MDETTNERESTRGSEQQSSQTSACPQSNGDGPESNGACNGRTTMQGCHQYGHKGLQRGSDEGEKSKRRCRQKTGARGQLHRDQQPCVRGYADRESCSSSECVRDS